MIAELHGKISGSDSNLSDRLEDKLTGNVLYYTTANATMRLVLDSKASEFVVEHHNLPVHLEVVGEDDIRLTCEENAVNGDAITNLYHVNRRTQSLFDLSEDEILCSYHYGGAVYFLYTDADGVMRVGYSKVRMVDLVGKTINMICPEMTRIVTLSQVTALSIMRITGTMSCNRCCWNWMLRR